MKKFITVAALLAAGTAFSNAATLVAQWNDLSDLTSDQGTTSLSINLGTTASAVSGSSLSVNNAAAGTSYADRVHVDLSSAGISAATGGFTLVLDISNYSNGANQLIADMVGGSTASAGGEGAYGIGRGNSSAVAWRINNAGTYQATTGASPANPPALSANPGTLVFTFDSTGAMSFYVGGTLARTDTARNFNAENAFTSLVLGGYGDHTNTAANSTYSLEKMALYSGVLSAEDIASGNVYAAIPEPSAFGLLAGVGALALVAARRRRTK